MKDHQQPAFATEVCIHIDGRHVALVFRSPDDFKAGQLAFYLRDQLNDGHLNIEMKREDLLQ